MDAKQAISLLQHYQEGKATPEEIQLIEQWYQELEDQGEWHWEEGEKQTLEASMETRLLQQIQSPLRVRSLRPFRWAAAAAIILLLGGGSYLWLHNNTSHPPLATAPRGNHPADIAPGRTGAVLTLAGGQKVILDNSAKSQIGSQGNTVVLNTNGQLTYTAPAGKPPTGKPTVEKPAEVLYNTLTTPRGGQYQLVLPDGSKVWLNAASSLKYPTAFTGKERSVELTGEAYFEVAKSSSQPFLVKVGGMQVDVLGTSFNINSYSDEASIRTTLLEGSVRIHRGSGKVLLQPGQQAQVETAPNASAEIRVIHDADLDKVMAWKNGFFNFQDASLEEVMRQLQRWYDIEIVYEKDTPRLEFIGKMGRDLTLSKVLNGLEMSKVHFRLDGRRLIVLP